MDLQYISNDWTLRPSGDLSEVPEEIRQREFPASVPGCVHTALLAADAIPDPYLDRNEQAVQWIGRTDWTYACTFDLDQAVRGSRRMELVFEGLDTAATVVLNGQQLGTTDNMHHPWQWDVREVLQEEGNRLEITFRAPEHYAREMEQKLGALPKLNSDVPFNAIRKMACNFGWDWAPVLTTAGIWKPVYIRGWDTARVDQVRPLVVEVSEETALVDVMVDLARQQEGWLRVSATLTDPKGQIIVQDVFVNKAETRTFLRLEVADPSRWWPRGHGDQPLYDLQVRVFTKTGRVPLDQWQRRIGLRTVELDTREDKTGQRFVLRVNGREIFCRGANWIPDDCFLDRACTPERYRKRIEQACDANMNMLRVWGGGIYETDEFYDICDELGVMVWQDFLFACACYAEEEPLRSQIVAEARYNIARLSPHPSLVLWNGCNENLWGYFSFGWKESGALDGRTWGPGYYLDILPEIVSQVDPTRPYWPASPFSGAWDPDGEPFPNAPDRGNTHIWDIWFGSEYSHYRDDKPRFCSEFGFQAPATWATLSRAIPADQLTGGSDGLEHRQRSRGGNAKNLAHLEHYFPTPENFDDLHYLLQVNQARALRTGVEWFRSLRPVCMGTLYWQFNDCWPAVSWSAIDGDGRCKPLYYATRRFYAPQLLTIQPQDDGHLALVAVNDSDDPWQPDIVIARMSLSGDVLTQKRETLEVPPRGCITVKLPKDQGAAGDPSAEFLVVREQDGPAEAWWFHKPDRELAYATPEMDCSLAKDGDTYLLNVRSKRVLRDLCVFVDRVDPAATISDQMVTMLPGDSLTFEIRSQQKLTLDQLTQPPVLRCVNDILGS